MPAEEGHQSPETVLNAPALRALIENAVDAIISVDEKFRIILFNQAAEKMFGYPADEMLGKGLELLIPNRFRGDHTAQMKTFGETGQTRRRMGKLGLINGLRSDGGEFPVEASITRSPNDGRTVYSIILRDVSERMQIEGELVAQRNLYAMLSKTSQAISQAQNPEALFKTVCEIAVEYGKFKFAWIGLLNARKNGFDPCAIYGDDNGIIADVAQMPQEMAEKYHALRIANFDSHGYTVLNNFQETPAMRGLSSLAAKAGVHSLATFPLRLKGELKGLLGVYSIQPGYFTEKLIPTLVAVAADLSYALESFSNTHALRQITEENRLLAEIVRGMDEACFALDIEWRFTFVNDRGLTLLKHTREEMIGKSIWDVFYQLRGTPMEQQYRHAMAERVPVAFEAFSHVAECWLDIRLFPSGEGLAAFLRDISARKDNEEKLRQSEDQFRQVVESIEEVFWMTDPASDKIYYISPAYERIWGRSGQALLEHPAAWLETVHPDDQDRIRKAISDRKEAKYMEEYRILRPDGSERWIAERAFPVLDKQGSVRRIVGVAEDITSRKQLEFQMLQAQKMEAIGQLSAGVAHDFNNLLTVIQGNASLIAGEKNPEQIQLFTREIDDAAQRAAALTRQLLLFGRKQAMKLREINLNEIVHETGKMLKRIVGEDIDLRFQTAADAIFVRADSGMMNQILVNLAVNSRDAMPNGGRLLIDVTQVDFDEAVAQRVPAAKPGSYARISVIDSGAGIPPEALAHIFEPFFTTKDVGKGTGLGLATVFGIAQQHGGWVDVFSEPGSGATFRVYLPVIKTTKNPVAPEQKKNLPRGNETILLVEDENSVRKMVQTLISNLGYKIIEAATGKEAVALWEQRQEKIDMLMTDIIMPDGMNGVELARKLQASEPGLKVLLTSGYAADLISGERNIREGVNFIPKPYDLQKLAETIRSCLDQPPHSLTR
ncbi:MAG: PAS domain S-box protein [Spirochaetes bacterium]|nr:PAS domain S-box protein [Spirochaetota bacterium]MBX3722874.1 PAS domain S-box protein [Turneriella sp.]